MNEDEHEDEDGVEDEAEEREGGGVRVTRRTHELANKIASLLIRGRMADFELGREIDRVYSTGIFREWPGFDEPASFNEWAWRVLGFKERKARQMRDNFLNLSAMNLGPDSLARALRVGWSKLAIILRVARTENDLLAWIDRIEDHKLGEDALVAEVRLAGAKAQIETRPVNEPGARVARAAERLAAADDPAEVRSTPPLPDAPLPIAGRVHWRAVFDTEESLRIVVKALAAVKRRFGDMGNGKALALMATAYMASMPRDDQGGAPLELEMLISAIENTYRVRLAVVVPGDIATPESASVAEPAAAAAARTKRRRAAEMDE